MSAYCIVSEDDRCGKNQKKTSIWARIVINNLLKVATSFVNSISSRQLRKHKLFVEHQEVAKKDVELTFGVLQARFSFLHRPYLMWDKVMMRKIMIASSFII
uniref:Uncharacterized protein n=1 Tax=Lactuca sativa TaxID=4236 RepID=A0A9R1XV93_LACSA|nr:hypothetical protein LSAT_V11C100013780 [Lactuca sativa]